MLQTRRDAKYGRITRHPDQSVFTACPALTRQRRSFCARSATARPTAMLHLYTADRGRLGAMAKGVRRVEVAPRRPPRAVLPREAVLHEGRGELCTSAGGHVHAHAALRERRASLERATQACDAVLRLLDSHEPNRPAYNLLCNELALLDADPTAATRAQALAFRLKLLLAGGFAPELAACAALRRARAPRRRSRPRPAASSAPAARRGSFPLGEEAHAFLVDALARPLAEAPDAPDARSAGRPRDRRDAGAPRPRAAAPRAASLRPVAIRRPDRADWRPPPRSRLRLRRGLARDARPARRQGRERRRDDPHPRRRARARRLHDHHRGVRRLHAGRPQEPDGLDEQVAEALARLEETAGKRARRLRRPAARLRPLAARASRCRG